MEAEEVAGTGGAPKAMALSQNVRRARREKKFTFSLDEPTSRESIKGSISAGLRVEKDARGEVGVAPMLRRRASWTSVDTPTSLHNSATVAGTEADEVAIV